MAASVRRRRRRASLALFAHRAGDAEAPWPELSEYDCFACHHDLADPSWRQQEFAAAAGAKPGAVPWGSWHFALLFPDGDPGHGDLSIAALRGEMQRTLPRREQVARAGQRRPSTNRGRGGPTGKRAARPRRSHRMARPPDRPAALRAAAHLGHGRPTFPRLRSASSTRRASPPIKTPRPRRSAGNASKPRWNESASRFNSAPACNRPHTTPPTTASPTAAPPSAPPSKKSTEPYPTRRLNSRNAVMAEVLRRI